MMAENCIFNVDVENRNLVNLFLLLFGRQFKPRVFGLEYVSYNCRQLSQKMTATKIENFNFLAYLFYFKNGKFNGTIYL